MGFDTESWSGGSQTLGILGNLQKQHEETYTQQLQYRKMHFFELLWTSFTPTNDTNKCLQDASEKLKCHRKCITYHPDPRCADSRVCPKPSTRAVKLFVGVEWVKWCQSSTQGIPQTTKAPTETSRQKRVIEMSKLQHAHHFLLDVHHSLFMESLHHKNKGHSSLLFAPQFPTSCVPAKMAPELQLCLQQFRLLN